MANLSRMCDILGHEWKVDNNFKPHIVCEVCDDVYYYSHSDPYDYTWRHLWWENGRRCMMFLRAEEVPNYIKELVFDGAN